MKKALIFFLLFMPFTLSAQIGLNAESLLTTIILTDASDSVIINKKLKVFDPNDSLVAYGITDAAGEYKVRLKRGVIYRIDFEEAGRDWTFQMKVTTDPTASLYRTTCKLEIKQGEVGTITDEEGKCEITFIIRDSANNRLPETKVFFEDLTGSIIGNYVTDSKGEFKALLSHYIVFTLVVNLGDNSFSRTVVVPDTGKALREIIDQ